LVFNWDSRAVDIYLSQSRYFNNSGASADNRGTRIIHYRWDLTLPGVTFEELSPVTSVPNGAGGTNACNTAPGHASDECFVEQFAPSVSQMKPGGVIWTGVAWHDTRTTPNQANGSGGAGSGQPILFQDAPNAIASKSGGGIGTYLPPTLVQLSSSPFVNTGTNGNTPWGDYEGMASDPAFNAFYPAWGGAPSGTTTQVVQAFWQP